LKLTYSSSKVTYRSVVGLKIRDEQSKSLLER
jgi:hypothetical protein